MPKVFVARPINAIAATKNNANKTAGESMAEETMSVWRQASQADSGSPIHLSLRSEVRMIRKQMELLLCDRARLVPRQEDFKVSPNREWNHGRLRALPSAATFHCSRPASFSRRVVDSSRVGGTASKVGTAIMGSLAAVTAAANRSNASADV